MFDNTHVYIDSIGTVHLPISSRSAYLEIDVEFSVGIGKDFFKTGSVSKPIKLFNLKILGNNF